MQLVTIDDIGPDWLLMNTGDAVRVQFQNTGGPALEVTRGTTDVPAVDAPAFPVASTKGSPPLPLDDVLIAPAGGRVWVRTWGQADLRGSMTFGWTEV